MASQTLESMLACTKQEQQEKKAKPCEDEKSPKCPRCESTNTKFCYYNNYSLSQPRYFCKSCRRYWTKGGTLRNVPIGGGCRKNKRAYSGGGRARSTQDPFSSLTSSPIHPSLIPSLNSLPYDMPIIFNPNNNNKNVVNTCDNVLENYGFPQNPSTNGLFHSLCHGGIFGSENSNNSSVEWNVLENGGSRGEMGNSYYQDGMNNSNYWGFPWQIGGGGEGNNSSSRQSWNDNNNGFGPYSWQGLINSPLM